MHANPSTAVVCLPYLEAVVCDDIIAELPAADWSPGRIAHPTGGAGDDAQVVRSCSLNQRIASGVLERLERDLQALNERSYGFAIDGFADGDPVCAMRYQPGDHFIWHIDNATASPPFNTRKLSFTLQLSPPDAYDGGDLEFAMYSQAYGDQVFEGQRQQARARGSLIIFPSFHLHRVTPVTRGTRVAIVGWLHGPAFR